MAATRQDELTNPSGVTDLALMRLPPIGFWSYSRQDDDLSKSRLSKLRGLLMSELQQQYGRDRVQIFQDVSAIPHGASWEREITTSLGNSTFFIPIITPNFIQSEWCCAEVKIFLDREQQLFDAYPDLPRRSRIFPLQLIDITGIEAQDPEVLAALESLQWFDFRHMRHRKLDDESVQHALSDFSVSIRELLHVKVRRPPSKEELDRRAAEAAAALAREEAEATALRASLEEERRQREAAEAAAEAARAQAAVALEAQRAAEAEARAEAERLALAARAEEDRRLAERGEAERLAEAARVAAAAEAERVAAAEREHAERQAEAARAEADRQAAEQRAEAEKQAQAAQLEAARTAAEERAEAARQAAERADAEMAAAEARAEAKLQLAEERRLAREQAGPRSLLPLWIALGAVLLIVLAGGGYWLFGRDSAGVSTAKTVQPAPGADPAGSASGPRLSAPVQGPAHGWLLGRWGIDGDCGAPRTITGEGERITIAWSDGRQAETVTNATAAQVTTDLTTYTRDGDALTVADHATRFTYRMMPCSG